ncbi:MAG: YggT family protein [Gammaproteobacteria bacterium]|jgi:YggT family protein
MDSTYLTNPLIFLVQVVFGAYALIVMLRFLFQQMRVDFHNPVSQFVVKMTSPALRPLRKFIPGLAGMDIASLVLAWLVKSAEFILVILLSGNTIVLAAFLWAIPALVSLLFTIFIAALIILAIISWVPSLQTHPLAWVLRALTEPLLAPIRKHLPAVSGLDFSVMIAIVALIFVKMLIIPPLAALFGAPAGLL